MLWTKMENAIDPLEGSQDVQSTDVLLGRGKSYDGHSGNLRYQYLIASHLTRYCDALSGEEKRTISYEIVDEIMLNGGRFLKRGTRCWIQANRDEARLKIAQAFQYQRRKALRNERNQIVQPPSCLRQDHYSEYIPNAHQQIMEGATDDRDYSINGSETERFVPDVSINQSNVSRRDNRHSEYRYALPSVASQSCGREIIKSEDVVVASKDIHDNQYKPKRIDPRRPGKSSATSKSVTAVLPSRGSGDIPNDEQHSSLNAGKSDPNLRYGYLNEGKSAPDEQIWHPLGSMIGVSDLEDFPQPSQDSLERYRSLSVPVHKNAEATLDGSGVHSLGQSSDDGQDSLISTLANINTDSWTGSEMDSFKKPKYQV